MEITDNQIFTMENIPLTDYQKRLILHYWLQNKQTNISNIAKRFTLLFNKPININDLLEVYQMFRIDCDLQSE